MSGSNSNNNSSSLFLARIAEQSQRYNDMLYYVKQHLSNSCSLQKDERQLFSNCYKNVIGSTRVAWRVMVSLANEEADPFKVELITRYKNELELKIEDLCSEALSFVENLILKTKDVQDADESELVFYYKLKGDYFRYKAEHLEKDCPVSSEAKQAYEQAHDLASNKLHVLDPIRLSVALNYSVFIYEILQDPKGACLLAKKTFDLAITKIDDISDDMFKDSTITLQLIRDNLTIWTSDCPGSSDDGDDNNNQNFV